MPQPLTKPEFTGEYFVPGESGQRIEDDHMERYKFASRYVRGKSVLDIACGVGYSAPILIHAGASSYDGVDISKELAAYANRKYGSDAIHYHAGDICLFDSGRQYDLITCFETIEHVPDYKSALSNLRKLLKSGGLLLISSPNRKITSPGSLSLSDTPANEFHTQEFTPEELLLALRQADFRAGSGDVYGQRQRLSGLSLLRRVAPRSSARLERAADRLTSPIPTKIKRLHDSRYFLVVATRA